ncbi:MAG: arginine deiminase family protein [Steroidobacteraceae bacterium]|jgi:dimethylargininase
MNFTRAIVRPPARNFAAGLSSAAEGPPDVQRALDQHARYVAALRGCSLEVTCLEPDDAFPDATFVEDTAIMTERGAILMRPGAPSREGEADAMARCLGKFYPQLPAIMAPGTVDGGDICEADGHFLIGVSARTNEEGARQLAQHLHRFGYSSSIIDIRGNPALLHLKSGIAYLGDGVWVAQDGVQGELRSQTGIDVRDLIMATPEEAYAANCVQVNDAVLVAAGYPHLSAAIAARSRRVVSLDVSEFRKMDGGLSCLSLRF